MTISNIQMFSIDNVNETSINAEIKPTTLSDINSWILATPTVILKKREITTDREELSDDKEDLSDNMSIETDSNNETMLFKREIIKPEQQPPVYVHIQNVTEVSEIFLKNM